MTARNRKNLRAKIKRARARAERSRDVYHAALRKYKRLRNATRKYNYYYGELTRAHEEAAYDLQRWVSLRRELEEATLQKPKRPTLRRKRVRELEIGFDYDDESRRRRRPGGQPVRRANEVTGNLRLFREDGKDFTEAQGRRALGDLLTFGEVPDGWGVEAIDWQRPGKAVVLSGDPAEDWRSFLGILMTVGLDGLRVGAVDNADMEA